MTSPSYPTKAPGDFGSVVFGALVIVMLLVQLAIALAIFFTNSFEIAAVDYYIMALNHPPVWSAAWWLQPGVLAADAIYKADYIMLGLGHSVAPSGNAIVRKALLAMSLNEIALLFLLLVGLKSLVSLRRRVNSPARQFR